MTIQEKPMSKRNFPEKLGQIIILLNVRLLILRIFLKNINVTNITFFKNQQKNLKKNPKTLKCFYKFNNKNSVSLFLCLFHLFFFFFLKKKLASKYLWYNYILGVMTWPYFFYKFYKLN